MDKTLRPGMGDELDSNAAAGANKDLLKKEVVPSENSQTRVIVDLPPALYMVTGSTCKEFPLDPDEFMYTVGRGSEANVKIDDNQLSPVHMIIMKLKNECLFMDRGKKDLLTFEGISTRQAFTPVESRLIVKLGQHWLIYEANSIVSTDTVSINQKLVADELAKEGAPGRITLSYKGKDWTSSKDSCLIGTHSICDVRVFSDSAAAFTAMVFWNKDGVFIERMGQCRAALCVDGKRVNNPVKLEGGEVISIGREEIQVSFEQYNKMCSY